MACENQLLSGEHGFATPSPQAVGCFFGKSYPHLMVFQSVFHHFPTIKQLPLSRVQTPKCRPFVYTYWLVENGIPGIPHSWIVIIPNKKWYPPL